MAGLELLWASATDEVLTEAARNMVGQQYFQIPIRYISHENGYPENLRY